MQKIEGNHDMQPVNRSVVDSNYFNQAVIGSSLVDDEMVNMFPEIDGEGDQQSPVMMIPEYVN